MSKNDMKVSMFNGLLDKLIISRFNFVPWLYISSALIGLLTWILVILGIYPFYNSYYDIDFTMVAYILLAILYFCGGYIIGKIFPYLLKKHTEKDQFKIILKCSFCFGIAMFVNETVTGFLIGEGHLVLLYDSLYSVVSCLGSIIGLKSRNNLSKNNHPYDV